MAPNMPLAHLSIDLTYGRLPPGINLNVPSTIISYVILLLTAQQTRGRISRRERTSSCFGLRFGTSDICYLHTIHIYRSADTQSNHG